MMSAALQPMTLAEARAFAERLADMDSNKMEMMGRRWDAYRYVVPAVIAGLGLLKPEVDADVLAVRKIMHAQQRAMTPPDSGWGNMSYLKGSYDDTAPFQAALAAYRTAKEADDGE
jgi:hypothetical protein